jgi:hypothetical protein
MALSRIGASWVFGVGSATAAGIVEVTGFSARRENSIQVEGKDSGGDIGAFLYGGEKLTLTVEGYASAISLPAVGGSMSVAGEDGKIMSVEVVGQNEDFVKVRVEGLAFPNI